MDAARSCCAAAPTQGANGSPNRRMTRQRSLVKMAGLPRLPSPRSARSDVLVARVAPQPVQDAAGAFVAARLRAVGLGTAGTAALA